MRPRRALILAGVVALGLGCAREDRSPEGAVRLLLRAIEDERPDEILALLAADTRKELEERARLASAQAGGQRRIKAEDLLVTGMPVLPLYDVELRPTRTEGDRASVQMLVAGRPLRVFDLRQEDGHWRIVLPPPPAESPAPPPRPRSTDGGTSP